MDIQDYYREARVIYSLLEEIKRTHKVHRRNKTIKAVQDDILGRIRQLKMSHEAYLETKPNIILLKLRTKRFNGFLAGYNQAIDKLEKRSNDILLSDLSTARVFGFGYTEHTHSGDIAPVAIPPDHWNNLTLDIENNQARSGDITYKDMRFLTVSNLEKVGGLQAFAEVLDEYTSDHPEKIPVGFADVTITLDGENMSPTSIIEWRTKRGKTRARGSIRLSESGLLMKNGDLNAKGKILIDMLYGEYPGSEKKMNIHRLETTIQGWLKTNAEPFVIDKQGNTYRPLFTLEQQMEEKSSVS